MNFRLWCGKSYNVNVSKRAVVLQHPWVVGIGTAVLAAFIVEVAGMLTGARFTHTFWDGLIQIGQRLGALLRVRYSLPIWGWILLLLAVPVLVRIVAGVVRADNFKAAKATSPFATYRQDIFDDVLYRWNWVQNFEGKWAIDDIRRFCTECTCLYVHGYCPSCDKPLDNSRSNAAIMALVLSNVEKQLTRSTPA